jgi:hypothetical protein
MQVQNDAIYDWVPQYFVSKDELALAAYLPIATYTSER